VGLLLLLAPGSVQIKSGPLDVEVAKGSDALFEVLASGASGFQWERSNDGGSSWSPIPGETLPTYRLAAVGTGDNGARFRVQAFGSGSSATSRAALLTVS
jgi:hypothetical protein